MESSRGREPVAHASVDSELLRTFLQATPDFVYFKDLDGRYVRVSRAFEALLGRPEAEIIGRRDEELLPPEMARLTVRDDQRVVSSGEPIVGQLEGGVFADGQEAWILTNKFPWLSEDGAVRGICGIARDFTDMKRLRDQHVRAEQMLNQIHDSVISVDLDGKIISWNRGSDLLFGRTAEEMIGQPIASVYPPEDHEFLQSGIIEPLLREGEHHVEVRLLRASGEVFHGHLSLSVLRENGEPIGMVGYTMDITERVRGEQRRQLLLRELDHRVKNTLAVVRALAGESAKRASDPTAFHDTFNGRLEAMAKAHEALARAQWSGLSLRQAAQDVLSSDPTVELSGPDVILPPEAAAPLCLALHELATNARKHGAMKAHSGAVRLAWSVVGEQLELTWRERGGPALHDPVRSGFGLSLIRGLVEHEVGGQVELDFRPEGLVATISLEACSR